MLVFNFLLFAIHKITIQKHFNFYHFSSKTIKNKWTQGGRYEMYFFCFFMQNNCYQINSTAYYTSSLSLGLVHRKNQSMAEEGARDLHRRRSREIQSPRARKEQTETTQQHWALAKRRQHR